jgi:hypothetical protein
MQWRRRGMRGRGLAVLGLALLWVFVSVAAAEAPVRTVVINEVELNPDGFDRDAEWVEILNVGAAAVDLAGWALTYDYPIDGAAVISSASLVLRPGQRHVFRYEGLRLRNDDRTVLRLLDAAGAVIDETGPLRDVLDNGKTWQRIPDGGDPLLPLWLLRDGSKNAPNA